MDLTNYKPTAISTLKNKFGSARYDPTMLIKAEIETVQEITEGKALLVDATNPMVMLMEMAAVLSANCIQENQVLLRKQYPSLAMNEEDIYLHMSDEDYLNRFASPATGRFVFGLQVQDMMRQMVFDPIEKAYKLIIPRDSTIVVDGVTFTLLYPIVIRRYENGAVQVSYDPSIKNPVFNLKNTIIDYTIRRGASLEDWIFFNLTAEQVQITPQYFVIDKTYNFQKEIILIDQFYYARAFYKNENTLGAWVEVLTTHTDQVFDVTKPTVVFKVLDGSLIVQVPVIYLTTGVLSGELRIDVYTTKGSISLNLQNYRQDAFEVTLKAIDEVRDLNAYTEAMSGVSFYAYSFDTVTGGKNQLDFEALRERVIYNSVGPQNLPITNIQLTAEAENNGFEIVKNVDVLTNRVFLGTRKLPIPSNEKLITPANIGIVTFASKLDDIKDHYNVTHNLERLTIHSKTIWLNQNSQLSLVGKADIDALYAMTQTAMVSKINTSQYFYTPFYYVLDASGEEFEVRAYALDQPYAKDLNFIRQNQTLQLFVNTATYELSKTSSGFILRIVTRSGNYYRQMDNNQVGIQLAFNPKGETTYAYINGEIESVNDEGERVYKFEIKTNHDLDGNNLLCITNSTVQGITEYKAWIDLETTFKLIHHTSSVTQNFIADETDQIVGKFMLVDGTVGNSLEELTLHFGDTLNNLWRRSRSYKTDRIYRTHQVDVPLLYEKDIFDIDPITGSIFTFNNEGDITYLYKHRQGDPVLDEEGIPILKYKAGDVMLDENGDPLFDVNLSTGREFDLLVVDGRYLFANDIATVQYRREIEETLVSWITDDITELQSRLLEQTRIFFYPKTTLGVIQVYTENGGEDYLSAEQAFTISLYVKYAIYNDPEIRETLRNATVRLLDTYIGQQTINMTEIFGELRELYGESVSAFQIQGLGGDRNYQFVRVASEKNKLCLQKQLVIQADKSMIVEDAVTVEFKLVS